MLESGVNLRALALALFVCVGGGQTTAADDLTALFERRLADELRWEVLWGEMPDGSRMPIFGKVRIAISVTSDAVYYCSHDLGVCVQYRTRLQRNWSRTYSVRCALGQSDEVALKEFFSKLNEGGGNRVAAGQSDSQKFVLGGRSYSGAWIPDSGISWTTWVTLGSQEEIRDFYKKLRPPEVDGLKEWLRATTTSQAGYKSITIPCFQDSNPEIFLYGVRPGKGPIVFGVFWNRSLEKWEDSGYWDGHQNQERVERLRDTIEAIACDTVRF